MSWTPPLTGPGPGYPPVVPANPAHKDRTGLLVLLGTLLLALVLAVTAVSVVVLNGRKPLSDAAGRVTISVPRLWSDATSPEAGQWVDDGAGNHRVPDLEADNVLGDRFVGVVIEPRGLGLAELHRAEVDGFCAARACVDRGQAVAVEVNGRRGLEQVLSHAGAEWTLLLSLESERYVVSVAAEAREVADVEDIPGLRRIARSVVLHG